MGESFETEEALELDGSEVEEEDGEEEVGDEEEDEEEDDEEEELLKYRWKGVPH